ncbi:hypothetical protein PVAND_014574 [Polypedilum vanderplanki]|uniref:C2H2-type domain-containing protein n=1 Tax=Polypedilum vanderplanki TaxID=319348 RepID=A0A9J6B9S7_POLVA|nr:hypothetical protein PVAND_014574 [Polypedilum vanderplanki]
MILLICPIRIDASDDLPKSICQTCLKGVLDAIELREKSVKSELKFRGQTFAIENPRSIKLSQELNLFQMYNESDEEISQNDDKNMENDEEQSMEDNESEYNPVNLYSSQIRPKKSKYKKVANGVQCPHCPATFTFATNARRHVRQIHNSDYSIKKINEDKESVHFCDECGATFSFSTNLRRHMRQVHCYPNKKKLKREKSESFNAINSSDLTQKYCSHLYNQEVVEYLSVISENLPNTFTYKCLLCDEEGEKMKTFVQNVSNKSLSNFKRHLKICHNIEHKNIEEKKMNEKYETTGYDDESSEEKSINENNDE